MRRIVAQLNHEWFFIGAAMIYGEGMPSNCITTFPPERVLPDHFHWQWDGTKYVSVPDYRGNQVYRPDGSTYYPTSYGPLPAGHSLDPPLPPPPTPEELAALRLGKINARLAEIDAARSRPLADLTLGIDADFATKKLQALETERAELAEEKTAQLSGTRHGELEQPAASARSGGASQQGRNLWTKPASRD